MKECEGRSRREGVTAVRGRRCGRIRSRSFIIQRKQVNGGMAMKWPLFFV